MKNSNQNEDTQFEDRIRAVEETFEREKLRFVTVDCPKRVITDDAARDMFSKILRLRIVGYGHEYPEFVVPCDTSDFFGTHIAVCKEQNSGELEPIMSFKMLTLSRSVEFRQPFYPVELAKESTDGSHGQVIAELLKSAKSMNHDVGYCCSWTIHPKIRSNKALVSVLRDAVYIAHGNWQRSNRVPEMLIAGVMRFKTPAYQQTIGYEPLALDGAVLGGIAQKSLGGEAVAMLHMKKNSTLTETFAAHFAALWENRIDFSAIEGASLPKAA